MSASIKLKSRHYCYSHFFENAIWHGLMNKAGEKWVKVVLKKTGRRPYSLDQRQWNWTKGISRDQFQTNDEKGVDRNESIQG